MVFASFKTVLLMRITFSQYIVAENFAYHNYKNYFQYLLESQVVIEIASYLRVII